MSEKSNQGFFLFPFLKVHLVSLTYVHSTLSRDSWPLQAIIEYGCFHKSCAQMLGAMNTIVYWDGSHVLLHYFSERTNKISVLKLF